jgi:excisionase family DNA binding protein
MESIPEKPFFTIAEVAQILHLSRSMLYGWARAGKLRAYGKSLRIRREDLINLRETFDEYKDG